ncbi:MAG: hypothetical protein ABIA74_04890 [bacterium]
MKLLPQQIHSISIKINSKKYILADIFATEDELFYHFKKNKNQEKKTYNVNKKTVMGIPDHISFHKNGNTHVTYKKEKHPDKKYTSLSKAPDSSFLPIESSTTTPLLIHSIYDANILLEDESNNKENCLWNLDKNEIVSIILFLIPKNKNPEEILNQYDLIKLKKTNTKIINLVSFQQYDVIAMLSEWILNAPKEISTAIIKKTTPVCTSFAIPVLINQKTNLNVFDKLIHNSKY